MRRVYKYPLELTDEQLLKIPIGAKILSVQYQGYQLCVWAIVDDCELGVEEWRVRILGTGHPVDDEIDSFDHTGTVQSGSYVWHVFISKLGEDL